MSDTDMASHPRYDPKLPRSTFIGLSWGGVSISFIFCLFRICVRARVFRRIWLDDILVLLAWFFSLTIATIWQTQLSAMYTQFDLGAQRVVPTLQILEDQRVFFRFQVPAIALFYSGLFAVKLSFLLFFRRLGAKVRGQQLWWWCVLSITTAAWLSGIGTIQWPCLLSSLDYIFTQCTKHHAVHFERQTLAYNTSIDIITDSLIITIPVIMLWNVRIPLKQKLSLIGIFSLTIIVMVISIVRVSVVSSFSQQPDTTWLYSWANIELASAIIVSCLASFCQLFVKQDRARTAPSDGKVYSAVRDFLSSFVVALSGQSRSSSSSRGFFTHRRRQKSSASDASVHQIVPLDNIYVSRGVGVSSDPVTTDHSGEDGHRNGSLYHNIDEEIAGVCKVEVL